MKIPSKDHPTPLRAESSDSAQHKGKSMTPPAFDLNASEDKQGKVAQASQENGGFGGNAFMDLAWNYGGGADFLRWFEFAPLFNDRFKTVLHAFDPEGGKKAVLGDASGEGLSVEQLKTLFSTRQMNLLMGFIKTGMIPERLFTGDSRGNISAQQRILIASIIIAQGKYTPGSFEQEVHAKFCGHWVQVVQNYAGVTSHDGANADSINGNFDLFGDVVLGSGSAEQVYKGDRTKFRDLPSTEGSTIGPIPEGSKHHESAASRDPEGAQAFRAAHLPLSDFAKIQPGDWLYIYNANGAGEHSVIFSHWASEKQQGSNGLVFYDAITFDQNQPIEGGHEKKRRLGNMYSSSPSVSPITYISRVDENAAPAVTLEQLLPTRGDKEGLLEEANLKHIQKLEKRKGGSLNMDKLYALLMEENEGHLEFLADRLTEGQMALLSSANQAGDLEQLIRLTQKLRQLHTNADIFQANEKRLFEDKLNGKYDLLIAEITEKKEKIDEEIRVLEAEKQELEDILNPMEEKVESLTHDKEIAEKRKEQTALNEEKKTLKKGDPGYDENRRRYSELTKEIIDLKAQAKPFREEVAADKAEMARLKRKIAGLNKKIGKKYGEQDDVQKELPYGMVAVGKSSGQDKTKTKAGNTGELWDVLSDKQIKALMD